MRNLKKFLALVMAVLMLFGMAAIPTGAAEDADSDYLEAAQQLAALSIMKGDQNGNLNLSNGVTRYQAALFFVQALTGRTEVSVWNAEKKSTIFSDVPEYGTAIDYAYSIQLILGRGDGIYGYNDPILYQDMLVMAVRALGYETANMAYPNAYILAAQTLGLTEDIDNVNFKAQLTRGETAQIIWNMLNTEVAYIDPLTNELIYPGQEDTSPYGMLIGAGKIERVILLEKAGYASGKIEATVLSFTEAEDKDGIDTVEIEYVYKKDGAAVTETVEVAAADLGIDADTPKIEYLGLPLTIFVNCAIDDFASKYDLDKDDSRASVVFTNRESLSTVENLGDAGSIRYMDDSSGSVQLSGTKYALNKYDLCVYTFDEDGWTASTSARNDFFDNFLYDSKSGYEDALNSYGSVRYIVRGDGKDEEKTLHIYYTPYEFGQYFVRELRDASTRKDADYVTIGIYSDTAKTNPDGVSSHFVERLAGTKVDVTSSTSSVSAKNGEKAKSVQLAGKSIRSGNFMFYYYNEADNILTVAMNCGSFKTGRLTGTSASSYTLKIDGTNKNVGFKGAYVSDIPGYDRVLIGDIIDSLETGKDNVQYVEVDGRVVYYEEYSAARSVSDYEYAIVSIDDEPLAGLLNLSKTRFERDLTSGLYIGSDGNVAIAVLDTATGKWELASLRYMEAGGYDSRDDEFDVKGELSVLAEYYDLMGSNYTKKGDFETLYDALSSASVFVVRGEKNGVYDLAEWDAADGLLTYGTGKNGIVFSGTANKTNQITADDDVSAARVTLDSDTVIVVASGSRVGVRIGKQNDASSVDYAGKFLSANSDLIVFVTDKTTFNPETWGQAITSGGDETWYMATADTEVETDAVGGGSYNVTVTQLLDLRTMKTVKQISYTVDSVKDAPVGLASGDVLYMSARGEAELYADGLEDAFVEAVKTNGVDNRQSFTKVNVDKVEFIDDSTIRIDELRLDGISAVAEINATVLTLDLTDYNTRTYDYNNMALDIPFDERDDLGNEHAFGEKYEYALDGDMVEEIAEPRSGVLDQLVIESNGETILIPKADADDFKGAAEATMQITMLADVDDSVVTLYVLKVLYPVD